MKGLRALALLMLLSACNLDSGRRVYGPPPPICPEDKTPESILRVDWSSRLFLAQKNAPLVAGTMLTTSYAASLTRRINQRLLAACRKIAGPDSASAELPQACDGAIRVLTEAKDKLTPPTQDAAQSRCYVSMADAARCWQRCNLYPEELSPSVQCEDDDVPRRCNTFGHCSCGVFAGDPGSETSRECQLPAAARWCGGEILYSDKSHACATACNAMLLGSLTCLPRASGSSRAADASALRVQSALDKHLPGLVGLVVTRRAYLERTFSEVSIVSNTFEKLTKYDKNDPDPELRSLKLSRAGKSICIKLTLYRAIEDIEQTLYHLRKADTILALAGYPVREHR